MYALFSDKSLFYPKWNRSMQLTNDETISKRDLIRTPFRQLLGSNISRLKSNMKNIFAEIYQSIKNIKQTFKVINFNLIRILIQQLKACFNFWLHWVGTEVTSHSGGIVLVGARINIWLIFTPINLHSLDRRHFMVDCQKISIRLVVTSRTFLMEDNNEQFRLLCFWTLFLHVQIPISFLPINRRIFLEGSSKFTETRRECDERKES